MTLWTGEKVEIEVNQAAGSTYMLVADLATGSSHFRATQAVCYAHLYVSYIISVISKAK